MALPEPIKRSAAANGSETDRHGSDGHDHASHRAGATGRRLWGAAVLNALFAIIQVTTGLVISSVVVLADSLHQIVDALSLVTALVAIAVTRRPASKKMTFGWLRADALGAYTSGLLLLGSIIWILFEAVGRLFEPQAVSGLPVLLIGLGGVAVNGLSLIILGEGEQLSLKAARLHLLVDLFGSIIVIAAGLILLRFDLKYVDPLASIVLNLVVLRSTLNLLKRSSGELTDRVPENLSSDSIRLALLNHEGVSDVHHVHVRSLGRGRISVTAHVVLQGELSLHDAQQKLNSLRSTLHEQLGDETHLTIQIECHRCDETTHSDLTR